MQSTHDTKDSFGFKRGKKKKQPVEIWDRIGPFIMSCRKQMNPTTRATFWNELMQQKKSLKKFNEIRNYLKKNSVRRYKLQLPVEIYAEHLPLRRTPFLLSWFWHCPIMSRPNVLEIASMLHGSKIVLG